MVSVRGCGSIGVSVFLVWRNRGFLCFLVWGMWEQEVSVPLVWSVGEQEVSVGMWVWEHREFLWFWCRGVEEQGFLCFWCGGVEEQGFLCFWCRGVEEQEVSVKFDKMSQNPHFTTTT